MFTFLPMSYPAVPESLRALVARLPFGLDDSEQAGQAFRAWRACGPEEDCREEKQVVDLWTYCFVRRYFLVKLTARHARAASDLDELVERTHKKIENGRSGVRKPERYPHWVSVVCKNTYLNYLRRDPPASVSLNEEDSPPLASGERVRGDLGLAKKVVADAVARLPDYLQPVAQLRFLESCSYKTISKRTDTPVPTARSYAGRARKRLRQDPAVQALLEKPPG